MVFQRKQWTNFWSYLILSKWLFNENKFLIENLSNKILKAVIKNLLEIFFLKLSKNPIDC